MNNVWCFTISFSLMIIGAWTSPVPSELKEILTPLLLEVIPLKKVSPVTPRSGDLIDTATANKTNEMEEESTTSSSAVTTVDYFSIIENIRKENSNEKSLSDDTIPQPSIKDEKEEILEQTAKREENIVKNSTLNEENHPDRVTLLDIEDGNTKGEEQTFKYDKNNNEAINNSPDSLFDILGFLGPTYNQIVDPLNFSSASSPLTPSISKPIIFPSFQLFSRQFDSQISSKLSEENENLYRVPQFAPKISLMGLGK